MKLILALTVLVLCSPSAWAASKVADIKQGNLLYNQQKYAQALEKYNSALDKAPDSSIINFDAGTALYKKGEYDKAIGYFEKSLLSDDPQLQFKGHYNLGNSMYKFGIQKENTDLSSAIQSLEQSLSHYKSLALHPQDEDAKFNEEFVKKELKRLEKKKEEQNKQKNKQDQTSSNESKNQQDQKEKSRSSEKEQPQSANASKKDEQNKQESSQEKVDQPQPDEKNKDDSARARQRDQPSNDKEKKEAKENSSGFSSAQPGELSREEAKMLLENYSQNEEPKGLLNLRLQKSGTVAPVLKDW